MSEQEALQVDQMDVEQPQEKMLTQEEVNKIVAREKQNAAARARKEFEEQMALQQSQQQQQADMRTQQANQNQQVSRDDNAESMYQQIQERINKELEQRAFEQEMNTVARNYLSKVDSARNAYEDFDEVTAKFDAKRFPQLVYLLSGIDNAGDVVYDLSKNRSKLANLVVLAKEAPELAHDELLSLSQSIALNKKAVSEADKYSSPAPLDRLSPTRVSGSNGESTISDLRNQSWLRG